MYSQLLLNGHLYKTDAYKSGTPCVGPVPAVCQTFYCNLTPHEMDTSLKRKVEAGLDGVHLRELTVPSFFGSQFCHFVFFFNI